MGNPILIGINGLHYVAHILYRPHPDIMGIFQSRPRAKIFLGVRNTSSVFSLDSLSLSPSLEVHLIQAIIGYHLLANYSPGARTLLFVCGISKSSIPKKRTLFCTYAIENLNAQEEDLLGGPLWTPQRLKRNASITNLSISDKRQTPEIFLEQDSERGKRKALEDMPSGSSPPMAKRRFWSRLSVIAVPIGLTLGTEVSAVQPPLSQWPFPNEVVLKILEDMPSRDLCSTLFRVPTYVRCNLLNVDDRHLQALSSFVELLGSKPSLFVSIVKDGEMLGDFGPLFQSIRDSGCRSLRFSDRDASHLAYPPPILPDLVAALDPAITYNLHIFHANSPIFFCKSMVALTLSSLRNSSLTNLSLTHTSLSVLQWTVLMRNIHLPRLHFLSIDIECPTTALIEFLMQHGVHQVWLCSMRPEMVSFDDMDLEQNTITPHIPIHGLRSLAGPHWYLLSLLDKVRLPLRIQNLDLELDGHFLISTPNYLSAILDITQQFTFIDHLRLSFYDESMISQSFDILLGECRTIPVKNLAIFLPHWYKYSDRHPLVSAIYEAHCT
ncbi:hypothetical protein DFJ58DRAFT_841644 [Suillus subalutaceus]|uniref:uncharacterized protein n=1 Tax=Suillus subalutaceus TaxID=48586 RepID=UPI001B860B88|nr:uncharacterized protein DFJ58DRAFT_841644 [Suillus subalutaceus]KAG1853464.1 hypothetical protein DFJ58DRAFT_841644 [Suillus subalutaceus]